MARAKLPASRQVLFVFLPGESKGAKRPYRLLALPDDERSFPWGQLRMINMAPVSVRFHLGEYSGSKARTLKPGALDPIAISFLHPKTRRPTVVLFQDLRRQYDKPDAAP